jgi:hypothetical protein
MTDWFPIDSAPRDGTRVLVYSANACTNEQVFAARFLYPNDKDGLCGWWESLDTTEPVDVSPTHWMPLPAPPHKGDYRIAAIFVAKKMAAIRSRRSMSEKKRLRLQRAVRRWKADMEKNTSGWLDDELRLFISWWIRTH